MKQMQFVLILVMLCGLTVAAQKQKKEDKKAITPASADAAPPASQWRSEEAKFSANALTLVGTFTFPKTTAPKKTPAILILGEFGDTPRDGIAVKPNVLQPIYKQFAEHFAELGFISFRFDKRCAGASTCPPSVSFDELVDDAKAALEVLRARPEVDPAKIVLFGHSEGGQLASVIAASDHHVAALIMAASPGRTLNKILREKVVNQMREAKASPEQIQAFTRKFDSFTRVVVAGDMSQIPFTFDDNDPNDLIMKSLVKQPGYAAPMFINDPLQVAQGVTVPVLILHGLKDIFITVNDAEYLNESFKRTNHIATTYKSFPDVDHLFKTNKAPATIALSQDVKQPLDSGVLAALTEWLAKWK